LQAVLAAGPAVNLTWQDNSNNETNFRVERRVLNGNFAALTPVLGANITTFQDTTASDGTAYEYRVFAVNAAGDSLPSKTASVTTPLAPPSLLSAAVSALPPLAVVLNWTDNSVAETGFTIQRATNNAFTAGLTTFTVAANTTTFVNNNAGLAANTTYFYRVQANNGTPSAWSNTASVITSAPTRPQNPVVSNIQRNQVTLSWTDLSNNEGGFTVQLATNNGFSQNVRNIDVAANTTSITITGLNANTRYYFRVRAYNGAGTSQWSQNTNARTLQ
jgi:hypothetical protein